MDEDDIWGGVGRVEEVVSGGDGWAKGGKSYGGVWEVGGC